MKELDRVMHYVDRKSEYGAKKEITVRHAKIAVEMAFEAGRKSMKGNQNPNNGDGGKGYLNEKFANEKAEEYARKLYAEMQDAMAYPNEADLAEAYRKGFNDSRQSVIDNIPDLEWEDNHENDKFGEAFPKLCFAKTLWGEYSIHFSIDKAYTLYFAYQEMCNSIITIDDAKRMADKNYKERIKQALGL